MKHYLQNNTVSYIDLAISKLVYVDDMLLNIVAMIQTINKLFKKQYSASTSPSATPISKIISENAN